MVKKINTPKFLMGLSAAQIDEIYGDASTEFEGFLEEVSDLSNFKSVKDTRFYLGHFFGRIAVFAHPKISQTGPGANDLTYDPACGWSWF